MLFTTIIICLLIQLIFSIFILIESNSIHREFLKLPVEKFNNENKCLKK